MLKVLIVDDEAIIRRGLSTSIDWEALGYNIVGEAKNGYEALELMKRLKPHVLITDIRMPIMDGIALAKEVSCTYPDTHILILSGYDDFGYAQEAIKLKVNQYLLKPVGVEELTEVLQALRKDVDKQANNTRHLQRNILMEMLEGKEVDSQLIIELGFIEHAYNQIGILHLVEEVPDETIRHALDKVKRHNKLLLSYTIDRYGDYILVFQMLNNNQHAIKKICHELLECLFNSHHCEGFIGMGGSYIECKTNAIYLSYTEAKEALEESFFLGFNKVYNFKGNRRLLLDVSYSLEEEKKFTELIEEGVLEKCTHFIEERFKDFVDMNIARNAIIDCCNKWLCILAYYEGNQNRENIQSNQFVTLDSLRGHMISSLKRYLSYMGKKESISPVVQQVIAYIHQHYKENIRLGDIADHVHVTPNYVSKVFKESQGMNYVEWLNDYRIQQAKSMLKKGEHKIYEVASEVGYKDYKYFAKQFKKSTGKTPKAYRERYIQ